MKIRQLFLRRICIRSPATYESALKPIFLSGISLVTDEIFIHKKCSDIIAQLTTSLSNQPIAIHQTHRLNLRQMVQQLPLKLKNITVCLLLCKILSLSFFLARSYIFENLSLGILLKFIPNPGF